MTSIVNDEKGVVFAFIVNEICQMFLQHNLGISSLLVDRIQNTTADFIIISLFENIL